MITGRHRRGSNVSILGTCAWGLLFTIILSASANAQTTEFPSCVEQAVDNLQATVTTPFGTYKYVCTIGNLLFSNFIVTYTNLQPGSVTFTPDNTGFRLSGIGPMNFTGIGNVNDSPLIVGVALTANVSVLSGSLTGLAITKLGGFASGSGYYEATNAGGTLDVVHDSSDPGDECGPSPFLGGGGTSTFYSSVGTAAYNPFFYDVPVCTFPTSITPAAAAQFLQASELLNHNCLFASLCTASASLQGMTYSFAVTAPTTEGPITLVDPVPSFINSSGVIQNNPPLVAKGGTSVIGAAADGVTQVLVRISGGNKGDQVTLTLKNDQGIASNDFTHDGYLTSLDQTQSTQSGDPITVSVDSTTTIAFAIYHAPIDFARPGNVSDATATTRNVSIQVQNQGTAQTQQVEIVRPPVLLIHGLWSKPDTWNQFYSAMIAAIPKLATYRVDYSDFNGASVDFNTPFALAQASSFLTDFKKTYNVAAAQLDFVVHSMGGLIANNMPDVPFFTSRQTYRQGYIHKLITIDTPYQGSPFAKGISQSSAACKLILNTAGATVTDPGAIPDLVPNSPLLESKSFNPLSSMYYKHAISGEVTEAQNLAASAGVDTAVIAAQQNLVTKLIVGACYSIFVTPLTAPPLFTFDNYFGGSNNPFGGANDLIVAKTSQLGPFIGATTDSQVGFAHFHVALPFLNLTIPGVLDGDSPNPGLAVKLLNTDVSDASFLQ